MHLVLLVRRIRRAHALPTGGPPRPVPKVLLLGLLARKALRHVRLALAGLVAQAAPGVPVVFRAPVVRSAPVVRVAVLVVRPVRVALVVRPVVLAVPPVRA